MRPLWATHPFGKTRYRANDSCARVKGHASSGDTAAVSFVRAVDCDGFAPEGTEQNDEDLMTASNSTPRKPAIGLAGAARDLYRALWQHARGVRVHLVGASGLLAAAQLLRLTMPWLAAQAINALQRDNIAEAGRWIVYLVGIYLLSWLLHGPGRVLERNVGVRVRERLGDQLYARIAAAPLAWRDGRHSGELQHRVVQSSRALSDFAQNQFVYLQNAFNFVGRWCARAWSARPAA
jgi:hypothetical protein